MKQDYFCQQAKSATLGGEPCGRACLAASGYWICAIHGQVAKVQAPAHECYPPVATGLSFPHQGGCEGCLYEGRCNCCGGPIRRDTRCTNGRCMDCHRDACTGHGTPAHGFGTREKQIAACLKRKGGA